MKRKLNTKETTESIWENHIKKSIYFFEKYQLGVLINSSNKQDCSYQGKALNVPTSF